MRFKNALVSCSNKIGLVEFLKPLAAEGMRIVSTGGTADTLRKAGFKVVDISEQTGFPEVMDGRVKTLHPKVHMALLARGDNTEDQAILKEYGVDMIDLVVGNLYPFEENPGIETIDIGGPSFLRSAAKNFERISVVCDPKDYEQILASKEAPSAEYRKRLASKVFSHTSAYDSMIAKHFAGDARLEFRDLSLGGEHVQALRYGENPQQKAAWFRVRGEHNGLHKAQILQGKELSYNNLLDLEAAISTVREFGDHPTCVAVKHNSPCGVASAMSSFEAATLAVAGDPQSVFGGVLATNFAVDEKVAESLSSIFLECLIAPEYSAKALEIFNKKKNFRVLAWPEFKLTGDSFRYRSISGGFLVQSPDEVALRWDSAWKIIGPEPDEKAKADLLFAWKVCAHLKSNAIAIAENEQTLGLGMGQVNRVDAVEHAIGRKEKFHPKARNAVLASDAFFPFADSIERIHAAGIRYVIQPGGSVKDEEVIAKAQASGITMVMTGRRHFVH